MEQDPHGTSSQRENLYDQRLVEAAIKPIQSPEDSGEQELELGKNTLQYC